MTLQQFNVLSEAAKAIALWEAGVKLATRRNGGCEVTLYQIEGFYIELYFDDAEKQFVRLQAFDATTALEPYLETMDIVACFL